MLKVAVLDDYSGAALSLGDWSAAHEMASITAFRDHMSDADIVANLQSFDMICLMRDRTFLTRPILDKLPNLKNVIVSGLGRYIIDDEAAAELGIRIIEAGAPDGFKASISSTTEFVWTLIVATVRRLPQQAERLRRGQWQHDLGMSLAGKTLGILGLGRFGTKIAEIARMFDMQVLAWSTNLTDEAAAAAGVQRVDKDRLFRNSDIVSVHVVLSERSRGMVGERELSLMKPTAYFINTSRGPIVDEQALISVLKSGRIAGAGLDVFDHEPLPADHPFLTLDNVVATPHLGFVTHESLLDFYRGMAAAVTACLQAESRPAT